MVRLGRIQKAIIQYLRECGGRGFIGTTTSDPLFGGLVWEEVEAAANRLIARGLLVEEPRNFFELSGALQVLAEEA